MNEFTEVLDCLDVDLLAVYGRIAREGVTDLDFAEMKVTHYCTADARLPRDFMLEMGLRSWCTEGKAFSKNLETELILTPAMNIVNR